MFGWCFWFSNWIGSCSYAACGRRRNTELKKCLKPVLPYPILPLPPCLLGSRNHRHFWRAIPAGWAWGHYLPISLRVLIIWYSSKFCPSITELLVVFSVCSPQVGGAGRNRGEDGRMEFPLWMLSQCGLGRTHLDCSGMAGSPPCSAVTPCNEDFWANQAALQFVSSELQENDIVLAPT